MVRRQIRVTGIVQCVGFRWFAQQNASRLGLTGWVSNQSDGSVAMEIQGDERAVDAFTAEVSHGPRYAQVDSVEVRALAFDDAECAFRVEDMWF